MWSCPRRERNRATVPPRASASTAASGWWRTSLPFGTKLRLTYRGRSVIVPVEDREPYIAGRTLDLSEAGAPALGMKEAGTATVCMERLGRNARQR